MTLAFRTLAHTLIAAACLATAACGQMGPLTLPDNTANTSDEQSDEENER